MDAIKIPTTPATFEQKLTHVMQHPARRRTIFNPSSYKFGHTLTFENSSGAYKKVPRVGNDDDNACVSYEMSDGYHRYIFATTFEILIERSYAFITFADSEIIKK